MHRSKSGKLTFVALPLSVLLVLCAPALAVEEETSPSTAPSPQFLGEYGWLEADLRQARAPDDQTLIVRGSLHNPYDKPVEGVRLIVRLLTSGVEPRELVRLHQDIDVEIAPGGTSTFNRELATSYSKVFSNIAVVAFALRRGSEDIPQATDDVVATAGKALEYVYQRPGLPSINTFVGNPGNW